MTEQMLHNFLSWVNGQVIDFYYRDNREENGHPLPNSCLENSMDRGAWWGTIHGVTKSRTGLSFFSLFTKTKNLPRMGDPLSKR